MWTYYSYVWFGQSPSIAIISLVVSSWFAVEPWKIGSHIETRTHVHYGLTRVYLFSLVPNFAQSIYCICKDKENIPAMSSVIKE